MVLLAGLSARAAADGEKVLYRLHLKEGQTFRMRRTFTFHTTLIEHSTGRDLDISESESEGVAFEVRSVDSSGAALVKATYDGFTIDDDILGVQFHYERRDGISRIKNYVEVKYDPNAKQQIIDGMRLKLMFSGTVDGWTELEESTGLIMSASQHGQLSGHIVLRDGEDVCVAPATVVVVLSTEEY